MVADLEAYVTALGLNRFVLLGLSMGGTVAIHYAGKQPAALEHAARMTRDIADCQLVEVRGSGHSVPLDKPDGFLKAVRDFLVS